MQLYNNSHEDQIKQYTFLSYIFTIKGVFQEFNNGESFFTFKFAIRIPYFGFKYCHLLL